VPPSEPLTDPAPSPPLAAADTVSPIPASLPFSNGDEETALARMADDGGPPASPSEPEEPHEPTFSEAPTQEPPLAPSLEQRVRRLEEVLALLQERRASPPLVASVPTATPPIDRPPEARPVPPPAVPPPAATAVMLDVGKRLLGTGPSVATAAPAPEPRVARLVNRSSLLWLLWDTWAEARVILRMFLDPRYHLPWSARVLPLVIFAAILTSRFWVPGSSIYILGDCLDKVVDLLLAFLLFKWLSHEARRYRQTSPDLPANLRL